MTVLDWLLDGDPSVRWQVLRDLADAPADVVAAERARVATEGWGARLLALRGDDGQWAGERTFPRRAPTTRGRRRASPGPANHLQPPACCGTSASTRTASRCAGRVALVRDNCRWEEGGQPFFDGEVEPCINGMTVALGAYFGQDVDGVVSAAPQRAARRRRVELLGRVRRCRVLGRDHDQRARGSAGVRAGHRRLSGIIAARRRGEEYLLERRLFRRKSTGEVIDPAWLEFSFPTRWHYDVLRALEYFRARRRSARPARRRGDRAAPVQAAARRHLAAREHASRAGPLRAGGR